MRRAWPVGLALAVVALAGCANIPEESAPLPIPNGGSPAPGAIAEPDADTDPFTLVRDFIGEAGNPDAAKVYLTQEARPTWGDVPPTIIAERFGTTPVPIEERKQAQEQPNEVTVVLTVSKIGRLGADRAYIPVLPQPAEYRVVVKREHASAPWRIHRPPLDVLITLTEFNQSYKRVRVYFFDPEFRVIVPDLRYVPAAPPDGVPDRVVRLLLEGPSDTLGNAVRTALTPDAEMRTNAVVEDDGALRVNLSKLGDAPPEARKLIAAQIVLTLRDVTQSRIRLMVDGQPLVPGHVDWRPSDVPSYDAVAKPNADLPGLFTSPTGRIHSLRDGVPIPGPAGDGEIRVHSAAQSFDGNTLAVVHEVQNGMRLRIGAFGQGLDQVDLEAASLTRPTWLLGTTNAPSNEVWTVQNGVTVIRVVRTGSGSWSAGSVNAAELRTFGTITDLRLSRDGVRLAAVASGQVVVASVVRTGDSVTVHSPRTLQGADVTNVVGVDWRNQDTVVVATSQPTRPVLNIAVDGFTVEPYDSSNLSSPVSAVAAAPDRDIVVTDNVGMWTASDALQIWRLQPQHQVPGARPFYPG